MKLSPFSLGINLFIVVSALVGETLKEIREIVMEAMPASTRNDTLVGKLLKMEEEVWLLKEMFGDQHRLHIGAETRLRQSLKQPRMPFMRLSEIEGIHTI